MTQGLSAEQVRELREFQSRLCNDCEQALRHKLDELQRPKPVEFYTFVREESVHGSYQLKTVEEATDRWEKLGSPGDVRIVHLREVTP